MRAKRMARKAGALVSKVLDHFFFFFLIEQRHTHTQFFKPLSLCFLNVNKIYIYFNQNIGLSWEIIDLQRHIGLKSSHAGA